MALSILALDSASESNLKSNTISTIFFPSPQKPLGLRLKNIVLLLQLVLAVKEASDWDFASAGCWLREQRFNVREPGWIVSRFLHNAFLHVDATALGLLAT